MKHKKQSISEIDVSWLRKSFRNELMRSENEWTNESRKIPKLVDLLFEKPDNKEKGRQSSSDYKDFARDVEDALVDAKKSPGSMRDFLNGPGKDAKVRKLLGFGKGDGQPTDETVSPKIEAAPVKSLKPTQREIEFGKSVGWPLADFKTMKKIVAGGEVAIGPPDNNKIVRSGDLIIDGHHRWSSVFAINPEASIAAYNLALPTNDANQALVLSQFAIGATLKDGEKVASSKAGGFNILGATEETIVKMIIRSVDKTVEKSAGPILGEDVVKKFIADASIAKHFGLSDGMSVEDARKKIAAKVATNLSSLPNAADGSPPRANMPQLDTAAGGVPGVIKSLEMGAVNFKNPLLPGVKKESRKSDERLVVERWLRLAGLSD
jgi:hypothetical protein